MDTIRKSRLYDVVARARCVTIARLPSDHLSTTFASALSTSYVP